MGFSRENVPGDTTRRLDDDIYQSINQSINLCCHQTTIPSTKNKK